MGKGGEGRKAFAAAVGGSTQPIQASNQSIQEAKKYQVYSTLFKFYSNHQSSHSKRAQRIKSKMPRSSDRNHPPHEDNSQNTNSSQASASTSSITLEQIEERRNSKIERAKRDAQCVILFYLSLTLSSRSWKLMSYSLLILLPSHRNVRRVHAGSLYELFLMYSRQEKLTDQLEGGPAHFPPGAPPSEAPEEGEGGKDWEDFKEEFGLE